MSFENLRLEVISEVARYIKIANEHYKPSIPFRMPTVHFNVRGTTAGKAWVREWTVGFNSVLLIENGQDFIDRTVPHEVAHLIDIGHLQKNQPMWKSDRYGHLRRVKRDVHGESFRSVMAVFGAKDDSRCHKFDVTNARVKNVVRYNYRCGCSTPVIVGPKHHNAIQRGRAVFCKRCRTTIVSSDLIVDHSRHTYNIPVAADRPRDPIVGVSGSKIDRAVELVRANPTLDRIQMINKIVSELQMSRAGAQTYYYNAKKKIGS